MTYLIKASMLNPIVNKGEHMKFNFDEWAELAKQDPASFELKRQQAIDTTIQRASPEVQQRLRGLQFAVDSYRLFHTPLSCCVKFNVMMHQSLAQLRDSLKSFQQSSHQDQQNQLPNSTAKVINLPMRNTENKQ